MAVVYVWRDMQLETDDCFQAAATSPCAQFRV